MKLKIFSSGIVTSVVLCVSLILVLTGAFVWVLSYDMSKSITDAEEAFELTKERRNAYLRESDLKRQIARVLKDVTYSNLIMFDNKVDFNYDHEEDRKNIWKKRIQPTLDSIDAHIETGFSDEIKATFNKINDKINDTRSLQSELVSDYDRYGQMPKEGLFSLRKYATDLAEHYHVFLETDPQPIVIPNRSEDGLDDDVIFLFVIGIVIFALILVIIYSLVVYLKRPIMRLDQYLAEIRMGNLPGELQISSDDFRPIVRSVNYISKKLRTIKDFAVQVASGDFDNEDNVSFERDGDFGNALGDMQVSLKKVAQEDTQRNHINQGLANFSEILGHNTNNLDKFCDEIILNLVKFLKANQGAIFVVNDDDEFHPYLEMHASYAYDKKKYDERQVARGQGLIGQAWTEGQRIYVTDVPNEYINITSGLGYSTPRCLLIVPLVFNEEVHGVIELASFQELKDYELGFVEKVSESISSSLASVKVNTKTQALLGQAEELTARMKGQEDDMRAKVDELRVTQEESQRREEEHLREIRRLKKRLEAYERSF